MPEASTPISERRDPFVVWSDNTVLESRAVLKACITAHRALTRLQCDRVHRRMAGIDRTLITLNLTGAWQLAGVALNAGEVLIDPARHAPAGLSRLVDRIAHAGSELARLPVGRVLALDLASTAADDQVCVRRCPPDDLACQAL